MLLQKLLEETEVNVHQGIVLILHLCLSWLFYGRLRTLKSLENCLNELNLISKCPTYVMWFISYYKVMWKSILHITNQNRCIL